MYNLTKILLGQSGNQNKIWLIITKTDWLLQEYECLVVCKAYPKVKHGVTICTCISKPCFNDEKRLMGWVAVCNNIVNTIAIITFDKYHNNNCKKLFGRNT